MKALHVTAHQVRVHSLALEEFLRNFDDEVLPVLVRLLGVAHELLAYTEEKGAADVLPFDELALEDVDEALECLYWLFRGTYTKDEDVGVDAPLICIDADSGTITLRRNPERRRRPKTPPTTGISKIPVILYRGVPSAN